MHRAVLLLLFLPLVLAPAMAAEPPDASAASLCQAAILNAERSLKLPKGLLPAIARVESGRPDPRTGRVLPWPWTIDVEGKGSFFATKEEAIAAVQAVQARGIRSIDVGCLQVNLMHHPDAFATLGAAFDPAANAAYGGRFLAALYARSTTWPVAASFYHSQTPDLAEDYRRRVMAAWGRPELPPPAVTPLVLRQAAYRDFAPVPQTAYAALAPSDRVYGAFARPPAPINPAEPSSRRVTASRKQPAAPAFRLASAP